MELSWSNIIFELFPEQIVLLYFASSIFTYSLKEYYKRIIVAAVVNSLLIFFLWNAGIPTDVRMTVTMSIIMFSILFSLRCSPMIALCMTITIFIYDATYSLLFESIISDVIKIDGQQIAHNSMYRIIYTWIYMVIAILIIALIKKTKFKINLHGWRNNKKYLLFIGIFSFAEIYYTALLLGMFVQSKQLDGTPMNIRASIIYTFVLILFIFASVITAYEWYLSQLRDDFQDIFKKSIMKVDRERHDMKNILTSILFLLRGNQIEPAIRKIKDFLGEIKTVDFVKSILIKDSKVTELTALLYSKIEEAKEKRICFEVEKNGENVFKCLKDIDVISMFGNLIDNAFDATLTLDEDERYVKVEIQSLNEIDELKIINTGNPIPNSIHENIFQRGFTTKPLSKEKKERGKGLAIVKDLVNTYDGKISIHSDEDFTTFIIRIPRKKLATS